MKTIATILLGALLAGCATAQAAAPRNGSHDFDWLYGNWHMTFKRLRQPLSGKHDWYSFDGTANARPFWDGRGNFESGHLNSPLGAVDYATLRLYNASTQKWSIYWATAKNGLGVPPEVGSFDDTGVGRFYAWHDTYNGRAIASRYVWTPAGAPNHYHFEQAFSIDGGKTWEVNWISEVYKQ